MLQIKYNYKQNKSGALVHYYGKVIKIKVTIVSFILYINMTIDRNSHSVKIGV